ncbi:SMI1/KNR4 family protein [Streptomyces abikoensis]|uniref:SMI1/KNR4 family protein n=1 Tax=Streptomyces abikoensis TaxID=97398 RepID=UPI0036B1C17F
MAHRFELLPPLTQAELEEAECQTGVRLPEEYRTFLLEAGAGGAGPDYGSSPLRPGTTGTGRLTFTQWYLDWLARRTHRTGAGIGK